MKIIWVKAGGLVPLDAGGKIRSYHIAKELGRNHEVTLFTFYVEESNDEHHTLTSVFHKVVTHPLKVSAGRGFGEALNYLKSVFAPLPYSITNSSALSLQEKVYEPCGRVRLLLPCTFAGRSRFRASIQSITS